MLDGGKMDDCHFSSLSLFCIFLKFLIGRVKIRKRMKTTFYFFKVHGNKGRRKKG